MNIEKLVTKMFNEMVRDYENKKLVQNKSIVKRTTASEILGGKKNV